MFLNKLDNIEHPVFLYLEDDINYNFVMIMTIFYTIKYVTTVHKPQ